jgi:hypothetical protein
MAARAEGGDRTMPLNLFSSTTTSSGSIAALAARVTKLEIKPVSLHGGAVFFYV